MDISIHSRIDLIRIFNVLGIENPQAVPIVDEILRWVRSCGPEWAVDRLKNLKILYLQHYAGNKTFKLDPECRIKTRANAPRGAFRALWTCKDIAGRGEAVLRVLNSYTSITLLGFGSKRQHDKFREAVINPRPSNLTTGWDLEDDLKVAYRTLYKEAKWDSLEYWISSGSRVSTIETWFPKRKYKTGKSGQREPVPCSIDVLRRRVERRSVPENTIPLETHKADFMMNSPAILEKYLPLINKVLGKHAFSDEWYDTYQRLRHDLHARSSVEDLRNLSLDTPVMGHIGFIQERGCKLRAVASPLRIHQAVLSKLHNWLQLAAKRILPWDCTYNQEKGIAWAQRKLSQGHKIYAFDLTNASDTSPLEDQVAFLKHVGPVHNPEFRLMLDYFEDVARGSWKYHTSWYPSERFIRWLKGQGLGINLSFPSFAQSHGGRLHQLELDYCTTDSFRVLGDDVIALDPIAGPYHRFVTVEWGCDISKGKSLTSDTLTEFASRLTSSNRTLKVFKFPKYPARLYKPTEPLELIEKFGKKALKLVPKNDRPYVQVMAQLPRPAGLGWRLKAEDILLFDPKAYEKHLVNLGRPERERDVAYTDRVVKAGGAYESITVSNKRLAEREFDVRFAFGFTANALAYESLKSDSEERPSVLTASKPELQWVVEHLNADKDGSIDEDLRAELHLILTPVDHIPGRESFVFEGEDARSRMRAFKAKVLRFSRHVKRSLFLIRLYGGVKQVFRRLAMKPKTISKALKKTR